jgi:hypothetical protein
MVIKIGETAISIPTGISNWAKESEDNRFEFDVMLKQMMDATNKVVKERNQVGLVKTITDSKEKLYSDNPKDFVDIIFDELLLNSLKNIEEGVKDMCGTPFIKSFAQSLENESEEARQTIYSKLRGYLRNDQSHEESVYSQLLQSLLK